MSESEANYVWEKQKALEERLVWWYPSLELRCSGRLPRTPRNTSSGPSERNRHTHTQIPIYYSVVWNSSHFQPTITPFSSVFLFHLKFPSFRQNLRFFFFPLLGFLHKYFCLRPSSSLSFSLRACPQLHHLASPFIMPLCILHQLRCVCVYIAVGLCNACTYLYCMWVCIHACMSSYMHVNLSWQLETDECVYDHKY